MKAKRAFQFAAIGRGDVAISEAQSCNRTAETLGGRSKYKCEQSAQEYLHGGNLDGICAPMDNNGIED